MGNVWIRIINILFVDSTAWNSGPHQEQQQQQQQQVRSRCQEPKTGLKLLLQFLDKGLQNLTRIRAVLRPWRVQGSAAAVEEVLECSSQILNFGAGFICTPSCSLTDWCPPQLNATVIHFHVSWRTNLKDCCFHFETNHSWSGSHFSLTGPKRKKTQQAVHWVLHQVSSRFLRVWQQFNCTVELIVERPCKL